MRPGRCTGTSRTATSPRPGPPCPRWPAATRRALDEAGLARATVESVAENTSDAAVAPLFWGAVAGLPGLLGYRAVNTLDAMVGHRSPRYARFGEASARLDDVANWIPARLTAALTVACAPLAGGSASGALRTWWRDGAAHPSPNSGRCEAALAGALGLRLGGRNVYGSAGRGPAVPGRRPSAGAGGRRTSGPVVRGGVEGRRRARGGRVAPWRHGLGTPSVTSGVGVSARGAAPRRTAE